jgi:two-component system, NtrC family, sensor kinase
MPQPVFRATAPQKERAPPLFTYAVMRTFSIKQKLMLITMTSSAVALLLVAVALLTCEYISYGKAMKEDMSILAEIIGNRTTAALSFDDKVAAEENLGALSVKKGIISAAVYKDNEVFATYYASKRPPLPLVPPHAAPDNSRFENDHLELFHHIEFKGEPVGTIYLNSDLTELHARLWHYALLMVLFILATLATIYLLASRLQRIISLPISHLTQIAKTVSTEKNYDLRAQKQSDDELGELTDDFNEMLGQIQQRDAELQKSRNELEIRVMARTRELQEQVAAKETARAELAEAQQELIVASREAGMAEVATGVLHNVGNVLNSVNVSTTLIREKLQRSEVSTLGKVRDLLRQHETDVGAFLTTDPKGKLVPGFIIKLSERLDQEQAALQEDHQQLARNVEHIKEIVAMQQSYARVSGFIEPVSVAKLLDDALEMNTAGLVRHGITIIRQYAEAPQLMTDKHKVLQILVNLVHNAKYALDESRDLDKRLTVGIGMNGGDRLCVTVADNGVGIAPANLTRIFSHGFTTREHGHGFGLHSGANAAKEMGGQLTAHSEGTGKGAVFTLELPVNHQRNN